jgi:hypothetical protein
MKRSFIREILESIDERQFHLQVDFQVKIYFL